MIESDAPSLFEPAYVAGKVQNRMLDTLIGQLHDTNGELLEKLHTRSLDEPIDLTDLNR